MALASASLTMRALVLTLLLVLGLASYAHADVEYQLSGVVRDGVQTRAWGAVYSSSYTTRPATPFEAGLGIGPVVTECSSRVIVAQREVVLPGDATDAAIYEAADALLDAAFPQETRIHGDGSRHAPGQ